MNDPGDKLPKGFQGPIRAWESLVPDAVRALRLPQEMGRWRESGSDTDQFDLIEVRAVTESLGRIEDALVGLASRLTEDGTLLLDIDNVQSMRMLHVVIEGRPSAFDAAGSLNDPSQALALRRVLAAVGGAGLHVVDVIRVPQVVPEVDAEFAQDLIGRGLLPTDWLQDRWW